MPYKPKELEKIIMDDGWIFKSQEGSHKHYIHPMKKEKVTIPFHCKEIPKGTEKSIFRQAGLKWQEVDVMLSMYPACFFKEDNGYSVVFPDLDYTATCGITLEEAQTMAIDCLAGYLYSADRDGSSVPPPSSVSDVDPAEVANQLDFNDYSETFVNMIVVDVEEYSKLHFENKIEKTFMIPTWLNTAAEEHNINMTAILEDALISKLNTAG